MDRYARFEMLSNEDTMSCVLGSKLWRDNFEGIVKEFIVAVWEM